MIFGVAVDLPKIVKPGVDRGDGDIAIRLERNGKSTSECQQFFKTQVSPPLLKRSSHSPHSRDAVACSELRSDTSSLMRTGCGFERDSAFSHGMGLLKQKTRSIVGLDIEPGFVAAAEFSNALARKHANRFAYLMRRRPGR